jgi:MFS family permease
MSERRPAEGEVPRRLAEPPTDAPFPPPEPWARRTFAAFSNRNYRLFFSGQGLSMVGSWARSTGQQWLVFDLTGDTRLLGIVSALSLLPLALLAGVAGGIVDRVDKRRLLLAVQWFEMACSATLAVLVFTGVVTPLHVVVVALAMGLASAFEMPCRQAFMSEMVGREHLRNAVALNSAMFNLALIVGPAIAAEVMHRVGVAWVFVMDAASYLAAVVGFRLMNLPPRPKAAVPAAFRAHLQEGLRYAFDHRPVRTRMLLLGVAMLTGWAYSSVLAAYAMDVLHEGERGYGLLFSSSGIGACVGAVFVASRAPRRPDLVLYGALLTFCASLGAMAAVQTLYAAIACRAVAGLAMIVFFSTCNTTIQLDVPDSMRGRVLGLWALVFGATLPIGQLLYGFVSRRFGTPTAFAAGAALCAAFVLAIAATRPFRDEPPKV